MTHKKEVLIENGPNMASILMHFMEPTLPTPKKEMRASNFRIAHVHRNTPNNMDIPINIKSISFDEESGKKHEWINFSGQVVSHKTPTDTIIMVEGCYNPRTREGVLTLSSDRITKTLKDIVKAEKAGGIICV